MKYFKILYNIKKNKYFNLEIKYLLNETKFYNKIIAVLYPILIPRHETELIINTFKKASKKNQNDAIIELGFGSHNISKVLNKKHIKYINVDKNFLCHSISKKKNFFLTDWIYFLNNLNKFDKIISNPPYIEKNDFMLYFKSLRFKLNLISKNKGFNDLHYISKKSQTIITNNGLLILEHSYSQGKIIRKTHKINGFTNIYTLKDINNLNRMILTEK